MKSRLVEQHCAFTPLPPSLALSLSLSRSSLWRACVVRLRVFFVWSCWKPIGSYSLYRSSFFYRLSTAHLPHSFCPYYRCLFRADTVTFTKLSQFLPITLRRKHKSKHGNPGKDTQKYLRFFECVFFLFCFFKDNAGNSATRIVCFIILSL